MENKEVTVKWHENTASSKTSISRQSTIEIRIVVCIDSKTEWNVLYSIIIQRGA
jgi:hypothetical protein